MINKTVMSGGAALTSGVSSTSFTYSDAISFSEKWTDLHKLALFLCIEGAVTGEGSSAVLYVNYSVSDFSGSTYTIMTAGSGTSLLLASGTSTGGIGEDGSYWMPLTFGQSGVTDFLPPPPNLKIGLRSEATTCPLTVLELIAS